MSTMSVMSIITVQNGLNCVSISTPLMGMDSKWSFTCRHRSRAPAVYPCRVPFMPVFAQLVLYSDLRNKSCWELTRSVSRLSL